MQCQDSSGAKLLDNFIDADTVPGCGGERDETEEGRKIRNKYADDICDAHINLSTHLIFPPQQPNFHYGNVGVVNTTNVDRLSESLISFNTFLFSGSLINCFQYFKNILIFN